MKKRLVLFLVTVLGLTALTGCGGKSDSVTIAVPNDPTNEARALLLLQENGYITLKADAGVTATIQDIEENPYDIKFQEVEAAQVPNVLKDVDFAIINSNYAIEAGLNPVEDSLVIEVSFFLREHSSREGRKREYGRYKSAGGGTGKSESSGLYC